MPVVEGYANANARKLHLDPKKDITVSGFHSSYRVAPDGQLLIDIVAQFEQVAEDTSDDLGALRCAAAPRWSRQRMVKCAT